MVGERPAKGHAVCGKGPVEAALHCFHLHVVSQHPLPFGIGPWLTKARIDVAVLGRRQERHQLDIGERNSLIIARCEVGGEDWELVHRKAIECVVEDAHRPAAGYGYRRDSCFYLTCYKIFWTYGHAAHSVVLDPANCEAVVASPRVAIPINVIDISVIWVYSRVVNSAKQSVDGAELGSWLCDYRHWPR